MSTIKRRYLLRESERKEFLRKISSDFNIECERFFGSKPKVEAIELHEGRIYAINNRPVLMEFKGTLIPTLMFKDLIQHLPKVIVDMGAVPYICNGADVMAPGIVRIEGDFREGNLAVVLDEKHGKAIAIVKALLSSEEARNLKSGKILKNIHYVGDSIWRAIINIFGWDAKELRSEKKL